MGKSIQSSRSPLFWVPTTYFAMGLPLIFIQQVLTVIYKDYNISNDEIAKWTSLLILPWSLKPLFTIFMETYLNKRFYQIATEAVTALMFGLIAVALPLDGFFFITIGISAVMAISGSMHDIAGDGIYLDQLNKQEQAKLAGWQGAFYNMAKVLCNGALIYLAGRLSKDIGIQNAWIVIVVLLCIIMGIVALYHFFFLPKDVNVKKNDKTISESFGEMADLIIDFFKKKHIWIYLLFIFCYRFGEGLAIKMAPLFLKDDISQGGLSMTNEEYGIIYGIFGTVAFILGSIFAGNLVSKIGLKKALLPLVLSFNIPFVVFLLLSIYQPIGYVATIGLFGYSMSLKWVVALGVVFEYFGYGFGFVGLTLFMMQQIAPGKYKMSHYAFANSIMNLSVLVPGYVSGTLQTMLGYMWFFVLVLIVTIPSIVLAMRIPWVSHDESEI